MRIDLHCYTKYSHDNFLEPSTVIQEAVERGLDGACSTEHHSLEASREIKRLSVPEGIRDFRGVEVSTDQGHLLVYGLRDDTWDGWRGNQ